MLDTSLISYHNEYVTSNKTIIRPVICQSIDELAVDLHKEQHKEENIQEPNKKSLATKDEKDNSGL